MEVSFKWSHHRICLNRLKNENYTTYLQLIVSTLGVISRVSYELKTRWINCLAIIKVLFCFSYLEIYNEHVRDLLRPQKLKKLPQQNLKVREHPKEGPYVEGMQKSIFCNLL